VDEEGTFRLIASSTATGGMGLIRWQWSCSPTGVVTPELDGLPQAIYQAPSVDKDREVEIRAWDAADPDNVATIRLTIRKRPTPGHP
jgi:hypothetical protein